MGAGGLRALRPRFDDFEKTPGDALVPVLAEAYARKFSGQGAGYENGPPPPVPDPVAAASDILYPDVFNPVFHASCARITVIYCADGDSGKENRFFHIIMAHTPAFRKLIRLLQQARRNNHEMQGLPPPVSGVKRGALTRRRFIAGMAAGAAAGVLLPGAAGFAAQGADGKPPRVAVVGAGLAGLAAAHRLKQAGIEAQVYEASNRAGGRILSRTGILGEGVVTDLGAELINTEHEDMMDFVGAFGIELFNREEDAASSPDVPAERYHFGGRFYSDSELAKALQPIAAQIAEDADLIDRDFAANAPALDALSVAAYLDRHAAKIPEPYVRALLENTVRTEYGSEPSETTCLALIYNLPTVDGERAELLGYSDEIYSVQGGMETITQALAKSLEGQILYGRELKEIRAGGGRCFLGFRNGQTAECDFAVVAIPFAALRAVDVRAPEMPDGLRRFIAESVLGANDKLIAGFSEKLWRKAGAFSMGMWTDMGFSEVWDETQRQQDIPAGALTYFLGGREVAEAAKTDVDSAAALFTGRLEAAVPGLKAAMNGKTLMTTWTKGRLSQGSYATFRPGQMTAFSRFFWTETADRLPDQEVRAGSLLFAGEHLSADFYGFMNGAAQTGRLAAESILRDAGAAQQ